MFVEVPEPVWKTSIGNWSSCWPAATSSPARAMRSAISASSRPSSAFTRAASALMRPSQRTTGVGTRSPETGKFSIAFVVSAPQSCLLNGHQSPSSLVQAIQALLGADLAQGWHRTGAFPVQRGRRRDFRVLIAGVTALIRIDRSWTPAGGGRPKPIRFCSRCGHPGEEPPGRPELRKRVCGRCGMGMVLSCPRDALPGEAAAFLILDYELSVSAVSEARRALLRRGGELIGDALLDLLTSPLGDDQLARNAGLAAQRPCDPLVMPVRLLGERSGEVGHDGRPDRHLRPAARGAAHGRAERVRPRLSARSRRDCARTTARLAQHLV